MRKKALFFYCIVALLWVIVSLYFAICYNQSFQFSQLNKINYDLKQEKSQNIHSLNEVKKELFALENKKKELESRLVDYDAMFEHLNQAEKRLADAESKIVRLDESFARQKVLLSDLEKDLEQKKETLSALAKEEIDYRKRLSEQQRLGNNERAVLLDLQKKKGDLESGVSGLDEQKKMYDDFLLKNDRLKMELSQQELRIKHNLDLIEDYQKRTASLLNEEKSLTSTINGLKKEEIKLKSEADFLKKENEKSLQAVAEAENNVAHSKWLLASHAQKIETLKSEEMEYRNLMSSLIRDEKQKKMELQNLQNQQDEYLNNISLLRKAKSILTDEKTVLEEELSGMQAQKNILVSLQEQVGFWRLELEKLINHKVEMERVLVKTNESLSAGGTE
jgi:chromosome segregation ATPase